MLCPPLPKVKSLGQDCVLLHAADPVKEDGSMATFHCGERGGNQENALMKVLFGAEGTGMRAQVGADSVGRQVSGAGDQEVQPAEGGCSPVNTDSRTP